MSARQETIITATTAAANSVELTISDNMAFVDQPQNEYGRPAANGVTFRASGMASGDVVTIQEYVNGAWQDMYIDGAKAELSYQSQTAWTVVGPGTYRASKGTTTGSVAVQIDW